MTKTTHTVITGGASGLGLGLGIRILKRGSKLSVMDLRITEQVRTQLDVAAKTGKSQWSFFETDVTDTAGLTQSVESAIKAYGKPDLVINSAGIINNQTFEKLDLTDFRRVMEVNLFGSFNVAKATLPNLADSGRLVLIASIAGLFSNYGYAAYGTSKFGVVGLATTLRYEYAQRGLHITCVCPPEVRTPMVEYERQPGNADPISIGMKDIAGSLGLNEACDGILAGIDSGNFLVVPGIRSKALVWFGQHAPGLFFTFANFNIARLMRKQKK